MKRSSVLFGVLVLGLTRFAGDKPHGCDLCHKKFALACNLRAHMKTHEGEQLEECSKCNKTYIGGEGRLCSHCHPSSVPEPPELQESEESVTSE